MAVSVDKVYKTVLFILNKEQRGYVTPAEFNSVAEQVQFQIFESYFPDGNQQYRKNQQNIQNDTEFFNMFQNISYKLYPFEGLQSFFYDDNRDVFATTANIYKIGEVVSNYTDVSPVIESITQLVSRAEFNKISRSKLTAPNNKNPLFFTGNAGAGDLTLSITPTPNSIAVNAIKTPTPPNWDFTTGGLGQYMYNPNGSTDFELDISEQTNLVIELLKYFGIIINDPTIIQAAAQEAQSTTVNEKS